MANEAYIKKTRPINKNQTPESQFHQKLNSFSKSKNLAAAISLYNAAISDNIRLNNTHYNTILYLCSISITNQTTKDLALEHGFRVFDHMVANGVNPNEASITSMARLAGAKGDGEWGFNLVKNMREVPRLRTYDPVLFCFCEKLEGDKAYEVEEHMGKMGVVLEEPEIAALLKVSVETGNEERVYEYLQKLRRTVRCVKEETGKVIEDWFERFEMDKEELETGLVRERVVRNGGGWHGIGWIGKGKWGVKRGKVDDVGKCCGCGEYLACVDIEDVERERFAESLTVLAMEREAKANFREFQDWLDQNPNFEAIVDGANIGLYQQNFAEGGFSIPQLEAVVKELHDRNGRWPLIVLHNKRVQALLESPFHRNLIQDWIERDILFTTPHGSNDDWYWLYAAVKLRCLLVTNDEMRDHIFELLGNSFFLKWKERHQVRYTFVKGKPKLQMPPIYSLVIQESEKGWHVPIAGNEDSEQTWLCISQPSSSEKDVKTDMETANNGEDNKISRSCCNGKLGSETEDSSVQDSDNKPATVTGKRKERSSSS
ncbi:proteinaceous RNase P 3 [Euphorbia peplus]|nr:proteinaceous RNase P 3 [Euphorbia peplus]